MDRDMTEEINQGSVARKQRVQRLKRMILTVVAVLLFVPTFLCVVLLVRLGDMSDTIELIDREIATLRDTVKQQQDKIGLLEENTIAGEVSSASPGEAIAEDSEAGEEQAKSEMDAYAGLHKVYLTFDDGPSIYTEDILDILDQYEVKATFFVVGKENETAKNAIRQIAQRGHTLGMHSYSHKYDEIYESTENFSEDFQKIRQFLFDLTGEESMIYRFPGGSSNTVSSIDMKEFAQYLYENGIRYFDWNISSGDAQKALVSVEELVDNSVKDIERFETSVILMHDSASKGNTVKALPMIIERIQAMEDTVILPITDQTGPVQHMQWNFEENE